MKLFKVLVLMCSVVYAESFYVLSGVKHYDPIVVNTSSKATAYVEEIKGLMRDISKSLGIVMKKGDSRVLVVLVSDVSLGQSVGLKVELELGEYVQREGSEARIFAVSYKESLLIAPDMKDVEDIEEQLLDSVEEMLEKFKLQYQADNKRVAEVKRAVKHQNFAKDVGYETSYKSALAKAKKAGKPIFIFMTTNYCPWCRKLENRVLAQQEVDSKIKQKYIPLMLNLDTDSFPKALAKTRFTPILYIVDSKSEQILHQFVGYSNHDLFLQLLEQK